MTRVLLVEDDPANRKLMIEILESAGHTVIPAEDGHQAVRLATERRPDLIVMDMNIPGMDGLAATRVLRSQPETAAIPVLAVTAMARRGDDARVLAAGCDAYLAKPVSYRELLRVIEELARPSSPAPSGSGS